VYTVPHDIKIKERVLLNDIGKSLFKLNDDMQHLLTLCTAETKNAYDALHLSMRKSVDLYNSAVQNFKDEFDKCRLSEVEHAMQWYKARGTSVDDQPTLQGQEQWSVLVMQFQERLLFFDR
jgi:hypothetical protein